MAENELIASIEAYLSTAALQPAPASLGITEPESPGALPAVVISLEDTHRIHPSVGQRSQLMVGALPWTAKIDLANPVLAEEPTFVLLDATRLKLTLPHGGQVRRDGTPPPLAAADINITVGGLTRMLTPAAPAANQFSIDATIGTVTFGSALPPAGTLVANYFLGQWEQRLARIAGTLRIDVCAASVNDVRKIAEGIVSALEAPSARTTIGRLYALSVRGMGSVGPRVPEFANSHRRTLRFAFDYESEINRPDSSGGIIKQIPLRGGQQPPTDDSQFLR